jgi:hypothetical protein
MPFSYGWAGEHRREHREQSTVGKLRMSETFISRTGRPSPSHLVDIDFMGATLLHARF